MGRAYPHTVTTDELKKDPGKGGLHEGGTRTPIRHQEEVMQTPVDRKTALELEAEQKMRETENEQKMQCGQVNWRPPRCIRTSGLSGRTRKLPFAGTPDSKVFVNL